MSVRDGFVKDSGRLRAGDSAGEGDVHTRCVYAVILFGDGTTVFSASAYRCEARNHIMTIFVRG